MARKEALSEIITAQKYNQDQGSEIPHWWNLYFENLPEALQVWVMRAGPEPRTIAESVVKTLVADCYADNKDPNSRIEELDGILLHEFRHKASQGTAASGR
jgi:hypothetical protein